MELDQETLGKLHKTLLVILKEIDRVARKNKIEYTLEGGTLLGAVRHGGFIPWDDDADVILTRDEYKKFYKACKKDLDKKHFFLQEYRTDPEYPWGYSKMRLNNTAIIQEKQEELNFHKGIFVDIFIYDGVPDNMILRELHYGACHLIRKCQYSVIGKKYAPNPFLRGLYRVVNLIPIGAAFWSMTFIAELMNLKK